MMKKITLLTILSALTIMSVYGQKKESYDAKLAKKLGADERGMKKYVMVMLTTGTDTNTNAMHRDTIFSGHMKNIHRLAEEGKLVLAGPMEKNDRYRGIFIFNTSSIDEARQWVDTDPAIKHKVLGAEYYVWYGSAAVVEIPNIHKKLEKK